MNEHSLTPEEPMETSRERKVDVLISRLNPERAAEMGVVTGKEALEWLSSGDRAGKYVFHGSPSKIEGPLEPRQAYSDNKPDGAPAVAATPRADVSIFRSIIHHSRDRAAGRNHRSGIDVGDDHAVFISTADQLQRAKEEAHVGYVYVFDADRFHPYSGTLEVRSDKPVDPVYTIPVNSLDLPRDIQIVNLHD